MHVIIFLLNPLNHLRHHFLMTATNVEMAAEVAEAAEEAEQQGPAEAAEEAEQQGAAEAAEEEGVGCTEAAEAAEAVPSESLRITCFY